MRLFELRFFVKSLRRRLGQAFAARGVVARDSGATTDEAIERGNSAFQQQEWSEAIAHYEFALNTCGPNIPHRVYARLRQAREAKEAADVFAANRSYFRAAAAPDKVIMLNVNDVRFKVSKKIYPMLLRNSVMPGNWDQEVVPIEETLKYQALTDHFERGVAWEKTVLFQAYASRLSRGEVVRGMTSIEDLKRSYESEVEKLYFDIRDHGFRLPGNEVSQQRSLPHVHIGRKGEVILGIAGNHRFVMARILKISQIPCLVYARHACWQALRESIVDCWAEELERLLGPLIDHPDLGDLLSAKPAHLVRTQNTAN